MKFGKQYPTLAARNERERLFFLAAFGLAFSLLVLVIFFLNFRPSESQAGPVVDTAPALTAVGSVTLFSPERLIVAGSSLADVKFKEVYWPRNQVPPDAIQDLSQIRNQFAKVDLPAGSPLVRANLTKEKAEAVLAPSPGNRAVSIEIDETTGLEGYALPGTRVDIVLTYFKDNLLTTQVLVQNARVLSLGGDITRAGERVNVPRVGRMHARTITLDVSPEDALKVTTARKMGTLSLLMRSAEETEGLSKIELTRRDIDGGKDPRADAQACRRGKMRIGDKEFIVNCDGGLVEVMNNEP